MQNIHKLKKRSGEIVPFDESKIVNAIKSAFRDVRGSDYDEEARKITAIVVERLAPMFKEGAPTPCVEDVQDLVERGIMEAGYFDVAKSYILYRYEHEKRREEKKKEVIEKIEEGALMVEKRNGAREKFSMEKLKRALT
ncbi:MAG: ATP cone domain-containing protein, partial [bacterium]|nr:ATP cone domain-containing protein [bacterium]